jgi:elongator complex protein 6
LVVKTAFMSERVISCRGLDTGVARDVSGVIRVSGGGGQYGRKGTEGVEKGGEFLYKVNGDGSVKVFERGAGEG